jgi:hypothetical protein
MNGSVRAPERQILARCRLAEELIRRQFHGTGGWGHGGTQFATEPTAWALLALWSFPWASPATELGLTALMAHQGSDGLWPAVGYGARANFWATAMAVNALLILGAKPKTFAASVGALVHCCPLEASWLVRLKFRFSDRQVRFDPTKYGWSWVPDTVSWVVPTSMALITLQRARRRGLIGGWEFENRLRLGAEMLLDRACTGGGWNAGNAVVYGVPLRPHIDATAIALAALRLHYQHTIVRNSLTWILDCIQCPSAYSLAWLILAVARYRDLRSDVMPALTAARDRLIELVDNPQGIQDTSTIALAALALGVGSTGNPFEVNA